MLEICACARCGEIPDIDFTKNRPKKFFLFCGECGVLGECGTTLTEVVDDWNSVVVKEQKLLLGNHEEGCWLCGQICEGEMEFWWYGTEVCKECMSKQEGGSPYEGLVDAIY